MSSHRPLKIFLSYAFADNLQALQIFKTLLSLDANPWLDTEKLLPGQDWKLEIGKALDDADVILLCLSKKSVSKEGYVQKEMRLALDRALEMPEGEVFLIPARFEPCELPYRLKDYQAVDLFTETGMTKLILSLNVRAKKVGAKELPFMVSSLPEIKKEKAVPKKKTSADKPSPGTVINIHGNVTGSNIIIGDDNKVDNAKTE